MAENKSKKPLWPQTSEGTTDWEVVFEDPRTGLIAAVSAAKSASALKQSTILIIQKLFSRDGDEEEVKRFRAELDTILTTVDTDEHLAATMQAVINLLRQIKIGRQQKAREYLAARKRGQHSSERRTKQKKSGASWVLQALLAAGSPKVALPIIGVFIALVGLAAYFLALSDTTPKLARSGSGLSATAQAGGQQPGEVKKPAPKQSAEAERAPDAEPEAQDVAEQAEKEKAKTSQWPRPVMLRTMEWPLVRKGNKQRPVPYAMLLYVDSAKAASAVCFSYPFVKESILLAFSVVRPDSEQPRGNDLAVINRLAKKRINAQVGPAVEYIKTYRYGDPGFRATSNPPCLLTR